MFELFLSFVIGIASGIISSIIVTASYRKIDQERDRQIFFFKIKQFESSFLAVDDTDLDATLNFLRCSNVPKPYKWIHLSTEEKLLVHTLSEIIQDLKTTLFNLLIERDDPKIEHKENHCSKILRAKLERL